MDLIQLLAKTSDFGEERKVLLEEMLLCFSKTIEEKSSVKLNFICTHNSRRSQLAEFLTDLLSDHFGLPIEAYSGGTEHTAFFPSMLKAIQAYGIDLSCIEHGTNPHYQWTSKREKVYFSKKYDHSYNPSGGFIAIMVCDSADSNCPFVVGADRRFALKYEDPKAFDNTINEQKAYADKVLEIGSELYYIFSRLA